MVHVEEKESKKLNDYCGYGLWNIWNVELLSNFIALSLQIQRINEQQSMYSKSKQWWLTRSEIRSKLLLSFE